VIGGRDVPGGAIVFVTFNNAEASQRMCDRLSATYPDIDFVVPPDISMMAPRPGAIRNGRTHYQEPKVDRI
jgi:hypothetical protein